MTFQSTHYAVRNPRNGDLDYSFDTLSFDQIKHCTDQLRHQQSHWNTQGVHHRAEVFVQWHQAVLSIRDELIEALTIDTGRYTESILEVDLLSQSISHWAEQAVQMFSHEQRSEQPSNIPWIVQKGAWVPYNLVGVISPWNFPLLLACIDTLPALMAGCSVILKPSEITPRFIEPLQKSIKKVPALADVFQVVQGGKEVGEAVVELSDFICFTGSVPTGRMVGEMCSRRFIPASLELGGKDPAILLPGTDLQRAVPALVWGSMVNAGQSCLSIERVYVHQSQYDECVALMSEHMKTLRLNCDDIKSGHIGPVIAERQAKIHQEHLQDAIIKGAQVHVGGSVILQQGGLYCQPTLLSQVSHEMKVMNEETFGPILPVMAYQDVPEAIQWANTTLYGLSAAIFGPSEDEAMRWASRLQCGAISINDAALTSMVHSAEKNAFKYSGLGGSRMGLASLKRFVRSQAYLINRSNQMNPWWF